ncbi:MAG TPA: RlmE family RNA methyltransferase [Mariprofundaceae bacterium]|nr:RlmE family RNA methyltransferase [Mariprofundaceae bacterium]
MGAKKGSSQWYQRHVGDSFVKRAQKEGKRSRAAFKLTEILDRHGLNLKPDAAVVDLGCAPGSWSAEMAARLGDGGLLVGIDLLPVSPVPGAVILQGDFDSADGLAAIEAALAGRPLSLVLSDMAPEMSGNKVVDQARMMHLNDMTLNFAVNHLKEGGHMLLKSFMGSGYEAFRRELAGWFRTVKAIKPAASRKDSAEMFLLAMEFRR